MIKEHQQPIYIHKHLSRIVVEAQTPLSIGSGNSNANTDQLVVRDINGLPYIPGTSLAGVIRHAIGNEYDELFGYQNSTNSKDGEGSQIIISSAHLVSSNGKIIELLTDKNSDFLDCYKNLPIRQHVLINDKGVAEQGGKYDEEVIYKGSRFCFELEVLTKTADNNFFKEVINEIKKTSFCLGSGTRSGLGEISVIECKTKSLNLSIEADRTIYLNKTNSLNDPFWKTEQTIENSDILSRSNDTWDIYSLELKPDDFFLFGSGFGNDQADMTPVVEHYVVWNNPTPCLVTEQTLIPGSSIKGALAHRVAYHYNRLNKLFVGNNLAKTGTENPAVRALFGYVDKENKSTRGNVIISDIIINDTQKKLLNHVAIDRFTGGAIDGALFSEEVTHGVKSFQLVIKLDKKHIEVEIREALEAALHDITTGMLALGGGSNRGHGCFSGKVFLNNEQKIKK